jgi:ATP-binding cassette subfamily B protein
MTGVGRLRGRFASSLSASGRWAAVRLLVATRPWSAVALVVWILANALTPNVVRIAVGAIVGAVPEAAQQGWDSSAGHRLATALIVTGIAFLGSLVLEPWFELLQTVIKARLTYGLQARLMTAVSGPAQIAHLEDPAVLDRVAMAEGSLTTYAPADAPCMLARFIGYRLNGFVACVVVAVAYRPWVVVLVAGYWIATNPIVHRIGAAQIRAFHEGTDEMRRARYFDQLATRPEAAKETRVFGLGPWMLAQHEHHWRTGIADSWVKRTRFDRKLLWIGLGAIPANMLLCGLLAHDALNGDASLATVSIVLSNVAYINLVGALGPYNFPLQWMVQSLPNVEALEDDLARGAPASRGTRPTQGLPAQEITFEQVAFHYPDSPVNVLEGLDLSFRAGTSTAIVGANGAGKTTLIKLLAGLHAPSAGHIRVDGIDVTDLRPDAWQQQVAVVFQDFSHYPVSACENVGFGAVRHLDDRSGITEAAARAGASSFIADLPRGWDTVLSREFSDGIDLSGGQWQRLALARALFAARHGATVLVLDEPTAWLDVRGEAEFFDRFLDITGGLTTIIISHRFSTVRQADTICVLDGGRVVESGDHAALVAQGGVYAQMFRLQAARFVDSDTVESEGAER